MSATKPGISLVILAYNEEATIAGCLDSIMAQTVAPDEIIVVNNNSTDRTVVIAKDYPVRVVDELKQGFIPARDRGFDEAKYEIIIRCDADSILPKNRIELVREIFSETPNVVAATGPVRYFDAPLIKNLPFPFIGNQLYMRLVGCWPSLVGPNMVITKSIWEKVASEVHLDDKVVHEDMDLSIHIRRYGRIVYNKRLSMQTSARRLKNQPRSLLIEYSWRNLKTLWIHRWPLGTGFWGRRQRQK